MINNILVAIDGSSHAMKAVDYAAAIAVGCNAKLIILTVIKVQQTPQVSHELRAYAAVENISVADLTSQKELYNNLLVLAKSKAKESGVEDVKTAVESGPVARTIVAYAQSHGVDVIVIGSRGLGNIEATLRGGVSHRVELLAKCAVLTVK